MGRSGEGRIDVADGLGDVGGGVGGHVGMHQVLRLRTPLRGDDGRQWLVLDLDQVRRVLGQVTGLGDDEGDRLARVADDRAGQALLGAGMLQLRMWDQEREVQVAEGHVGGGVDGDHARQRPGGGGVNGMNARVREGRAHERALQGTIPEIVRVAALPTQEPLVLEPLDALAEESGGHACRDSSAARRTLRRMLA